MAKDASFDIVSEFDRQELVNAVDQTRRDIGARFDLKDSHSELELAEDTLTLTSSDELKLRNIEALLEEKLIKRGISANVLDREGDKPEDALGGRVRQVYKLRKGIDKDLARKIVAEVKETKLRVQASIQGEQVRVTGKNRDDLQAVIAKIREQGERWAVPLQFENFR